MISAKCDSNLEDQEFAQEGKSGTLHGQEGEAQIEVPEESETGETAISILGWRECENTTRRRNACCDGE